MEGKGSLPCCPLPTCVGPTGRHMAGTSVACPGTPALHAAHWAQVTADTPLKDGQRMRHFIHRHEPPVPAGPIPVVGTSAGLLGRPMLLWDFYQLPVTPWQYA